MSNAMMWWGIAACVLIAAELVAPEIFLLWLGLAAAAMVPVVWLVPGMSLLAQAIAFGAFSFLSIGAYIKFIRGRGAAPDNPRLNKRGAQLIGQVVPLHEAIVNGKGRVKWGDALWTVEGPDLPVGSQVRIVGAESMMLRVEKM
jgi:membrane protein implicated in regulation of membrane protease activity